MQRHTWEVIGTTFSVTIWDDLPSHQVTALFGAVEQLSRQFDALYSRFKADSLITKLSETIGQVVVPADLVDMLRLYERLFVATSGKLNPAIGNALVDAGYDAAYSLVPKAAIRAVPPLDRVLTIVDDTTIVLHEPVLLDLGALGKGYLIDAIYTYLTAANLARFLVDGSGDIRYFSVTQEPIVCGLEDPCDPQKAIGTLTITGGALCASAINRRRWGTYHHYLDPHTRTSPSYVIASFVYAQTAAAADGLASALFFVAPEALTDFTFSYLLVNETMQIKRSADFTADLFA